MSAPVIAIDGPTCVGQGYGREKVARALGWTYLDSGALYRPVRIRRSAKASTSTTRRGSRRSRARCRCGSGRGCIELAGNDVTEVLRDESVGNAASARRGAARSARGAARVAAATSARRPDRRDGRDMGTVVFPDAELKVFLTASVESRAERRYKQLIEKGFSAKLPDLLRDLQQRDARDANRAVAPLRPAEDCDGDRLHASRRRRHRRTGAEGASRAQAPGLLTICPDFATPPGRFLPYERPARTSSYGNNLLNTATATSVSVPSAEAESFARMFEESLSRQEMRLGEVITAEVVRLDHNFVVVNAGLKSESFIPIEEFHNDRGELDVKEGDFVSVAIEALEDGLRRDAPVARPRQAPVRVDQPRRRRTSRVSRSTARSPARSRAASRS